MDKNHYTLSLLTHRCEMVPIAWCRSPIIHSTFTWVKHWRRPARGFFVPPPTLKLGHPTIDWKHFGRHAQQFVDEELVGQRHNNKEPKKHDEAMANSNESSSRLETSGFLRLPAGQSWTFENQFVISASENDWIATDSVLVHDKGLAYREGDIPETRIENIAVALRRRSEIAPKSSPPGSTPAPR